MIRGASTSLLATEESHMSCENGSFSTQYRRVHVLEVEQYDRLPCLLGRAAEADVEAGGGRVEQ